MTVFVDTSAFFALVDERDQNHQRALDWFAGPGSDPAQLLVTHSYVVVESSALVGRRVGHDASRLLLDALVPSSSVFYVDEELHRIAVAAYLAGGTKHSLVDAVSFEMMRHRAISVAFAFDRDFANEGFELVPA